MFFMFPRPNLVDHPPAGDTREEGARVFGERMKVPAVDCFEKDVAEGDG